MKHFPPCPAMCFSKLIMSLSLWLPSPTSGSWSHGRSAESDESALLLQYTSGCSHKRQALIKFTPSNKKLHFCSKELRTVWKIEENVVSVKLHDRCFLQKWDDPKIFSLIVSHASASLHLSMLFSLSRSIHIQSHPFSSVLAASKWFTDDSLLLQFYAEVWCFLFDFYH